MNLILTGQEIDKCISERLFIRLSRSGPVVFLLHPESDFVFHQSTYKLLQLIDKEVFSKQSIHYKIYGMM